MGRIRTIKPEFWTNEALCGLSLETHVCAAGLLNYADDEGYFNANPSLVKAAIFPLRETSVSVHDMLTYLSRVGYLRLGAVADGRRYGQVVKFTEHQRVNRPTPSKIKGLDILWEDSVSAHAQLTEDSLPELGTGNRELGIGNRERGRQHGAVAPHRFKRPTLEQVKAYCEERKNSVNPEKWFAHYESNGWKVGKNAMQDWQAAVRTWETNHHAKGGANGNGNGYATKAERIQAANLRARDQVLAELGPD